MANSEVKNATHLRRPQADPPLGRATTTRSSRSPGSRSPTPGRRPATAPSGAAATAVADGGRGPDSQSLAGPTAATLALGPESRPRPDARRRHGGHGQGRLPRPRHDGRGDGHQPRPRRLPGRRLEPDAPTAPRSSPTSASTFAATPAAVAAALGLVVVCVSDTPDVEAVLFGHGRRRRGARPGRSSSTARRSRRRAAGTSPRACASAGCAMVDAPSRAAARARRTRRSRSSSAVTTPTWSAPGRSSRRWAGPSPMSARSAPGRPSRP